MSYSGNGTFLINSAGQPVVPGTTITTTAFNALTADLASGLTTAMTKDGQTVPTANIPMGGFKLTGLGAGTSATDAAQFGQLQNAPVATLITVAGADTITGTLVQTLTAYATGQQFSFVAAGTNTTAVTLNIDGLGAKAVTRTGAVALAAGALVSGQMAIVEYDGTRFQLINANAFTNLTVSGALTVGTTLAVTGVATLTAQPILSSLTASLPVFSDASKGLVSNTMTGTGSVMMSASPTTTGTLTAAAINASGTVAMAGAATVGTTLGVTGILTASSDVNLSGSGPILAGGTAAGSWRARNSDGSAQIQFYGPSHATLASKLVLSADGGVSVTGTLGVGNAGNSGIQLYITATGTKYGLYVDGSSGVMLYSGINSQTFSSGESATNSALFVRKDSTSSRSISAAGTINASGADYAEYERKASLDSVFSKGAIVGFDENGLLTKTKAVSYGVKSTNPSYVGNDAWAADVGQRSEPLKDDATEEEKATHAAETKAFEARLESARQWVDRIAYSGKAPVNVMEASPGDLIVADNGGEAWDLTADATVPDWFKKYLRTVGRVRRILPDGRAEIAVYVH